MSLDGTATVYVNSSIAALNALRGTTFDASPAARVDTQALRAYYTTADTQVTRVTSWRRANRRFVQVRADVTDINRARRGGAVRVVDLPLRQDDNLFVYQQTVGAPAAKAAGNEGWNGRELVAFRLHLPSKIRYHNTAASKAAATFSRGSSRSPTACAANRSPSKRGWIRDRSSTRRCGCSARRFSPSPPLLPP